MKRKLSRREFLEFLGITAGGIAFTQVYNPAVAKAIEGVVKEAPPVLWTTGGTCGGCSISALNSMNPGIGKILLELVSVKYQPNISAASGELAVGALLDSIEKYQGQYVYVQEGSVATAYDGRFSIIGHYKGKDYTMLEVSQLMSENAAACVAIGTCASFGGIPSCPPNPTGAKGLRDVTDKPVVNIPGCPVHPDDLFGTLIYFLKSGLPELDRHGRPLLFFGENVHEKCHLKEQFDNEIFASNFGEKDKCYASLGCLGPKTYCRSATRGWNNNVNWCVKSGSHCIRCTEPDFGKKPGGLYFETKEEI
jgi:hydrogenase small subunit